MIKNSKKRREDKEKELEKERKNQELTYYMEQQANDIEQLQEELDECKQKLEDHSRDTELLRKLYEGGYIDQDGKPTYQNNENN